MATPNTFFVVPVHGYYGARVFVPRDIEKGYYDTLRDRCKWGGPDKEEAGYIGFEVPDDALLFLLDLLRAGGYREIDTREVFK